MQSARSGHCRYLHLDGLRGIAAMVVVFHHCLLTFPAWYTAHVSGPSSIPAAIFVFSPLHLLWAGHAAVIVFFALSGFVLALMLLRSPRMGYGGFVAKRVCRIYLPCIGVVAIALAAMSATVPHGMPHLSVWFNNSWSPGVDNQVLLDHVLLLGRPAYNYVDNPIWSLVHEVRYSLAFPLILWIAAKSRAFIVLTVSMMASLAATLALHRLSAWNPILDSLQYAFPFAAGAVLAVHVSAVQAWYRRQSRGTRICLALLSIVLLTSDGLAYSTLRWVRWAVVLGTYTGSVLLLLCMLGAQRGRALLETRFCCGSGGSPTAYTRRISLSY